MSLDKHQTPVLQLDNTAMRVLMAGPENGILLVSDSTSIGETPLFMQVLISPPHSISTCVKCIKDKLYL